LIRFLIGLLFGVILTAEGFVFAGVGHGTYAPLVFVSSVVALIPVVGLFTGPLLWAVYFLAIPNLEGLGRRLFALSFVLLVHFIPGIFVASGDPAFFRADATLLLLFGASALAMIGCLLFFSIRGSARN
jgi:hypothetical protein